MATQTPFVTPIRSILCAIDLSDQTSCVLSAAAGIAEAFDARLLVAHTVEMWDSRYDFVVADMARKIEAQAHEKLQAELQLLGKNTEVPVEVIIEKGAPAAKLLQIIRKHRPDMVVVGTHCRRGLDRLLLGSVADKIVRVSPVSVLVARPPRNPVKRTVVCAVDLSDWSRAALEQALEVARHENISSIKVLHVYAVPLGYMEAGMTYVSAANKIRDVHAAELEEFLKPYAGSTPACEPVLEEGPPATTIATYAEKIGADLVVLGAHGRSRIAALLIGGVSIKVIHESKTSVLAVKATDRPDSLWESLDDL